MKRFLRLLTLAGAVAGAVWYSRQQNEQQTVPTTGGGEWVAKPSLKAVPDVPDRPAETAGDDLTDIKGVGPKYARQLSELGIATFADLAQADPTTLAAAFDARADVADWIAQAGERSGS